MAPRKDSEICNDGNNSTCSNQGEEKKENQRKNTVITLKKIMLELLKSEEDLKKIIPFLNK